MLPRRRWLALGDPGVRRILTLMGPAIVGVSVAQISLLINTIFASFSATGSVSWLYYADRLMEFPSGAARRRARHDPAAVARQVPRRAASMTSTRGCSTGACA